MGKTIMVYGFDTGVTPVVVKEFLEQHTGEGTVFALEIQPLKNDKQRLHVKVEFTTEEICELLISLTKTGLWFENSYLKAWFIRRNIIKETSIFLHILDNVTLNLGCLLSKEKFSVLWSQTDVSVRFSDKKLYFFLTYLSTEYKLELSSDSIWNAWLHHPRGQNTKFLLIQLRGAPRIYEKDACELSYFKEAIYEQWVREVDFTTSCCIGQSSAICLELPQNTKVPNFQEMLVHYNESKGELILEKGTTYSSDSYLVPMVNPPQGLDLPYKILFKVNSLLQHGYLPGPALNANFFQLVDPQRVNIAYIENALETLFSLKECCYDPVQWLTEQYIKYQKSEKPPESPSIALDRGLVYVRRVQVTPSKVYFCGPEANLSNRIVRSFLPDIDNFIRVNFADEELGKMYSMDLTTEEKRTNIYVRIVSVFKNGIVIGDKKFEFLAFSSSQLRDNSVWMFAARPGLSAADIREGMGEFNEIKNVAKYASRLGQSFSSSLETLSVSKDEIEVIPDILCTESKYVFSDGIGKISAEMGYTVAKRCGLRGYSPSAYQIRYAGYKGVVAVDPASSAKLSLRNSMKKYKSKSTTLDVLGWSKYHPCFLNRQLITLLSSRKVKDKVFVKKQKEALAQLDAILIDPVKAVEVLEMMSPGVNTKILREMLLCGYKPDSEPFLSAMLQTFHAAKLYDIRTKTRICIPNGRSMMGCLDETGTLEYGQVFVQYAALKRNRIFDGAGLVGINHIVEGNVVVAKNPCLHPGDIRVLNAVDVPSLHHFVDCVVFPQKGKRPHPNECSGSDLDGDLYFVCWDPDLIPLIDFEPMDYTPAPALTLDHDVSIEEIMGYFVDYIVDDSLGVISNAHTVFADKEPDKAMSKHCLELAKLCSTAVDFPKTGIPAKIPPYLRVHEYPDFMEKHDRPKYISQNVIGKLFRQVKDIPSYTNGISFSREMAKKYYDLDMEVDGFKDYIKDAYLCKSRYDSKLANLMRYYGIQTEAEMISGCIIKTSKSFDRRRDMEQIFSNVKALMKEARGWFMKPEPGRVPNVYAKASAWYHVTYHPTFWGCYNEGKDRDHFVSFPWCVCARLLQIKRGSPSIKKSLPEPPSSTLYRFLYELKSLVFGGPRG